VTGLDIMLLIAIPFSGFVGFKIGWKRCELHWKP
jgi:hypothetical protein